MDDKIDKVVVKEFRSISSSTKLNELGRVLGRHTFALVDNKYVVSSFDLLNFMKDKYWRSPYVYLSEKVILSYLIYHLSNCFPYYSFIINYYLNETLAAPSPKRGRPHLYPLTFQDPHSLSQIASQGLDQSSRVGLHWLLTNQDTWVWGHDKQGNHSGWDLEEKAWSRIEDKDISEGVQVWGCWWQSRNSSQEEVMHRDCT